ncbi:MAG: sulfotransferase [Candidatus Omnitrophica bacterium]|nr:sulfotransferase [Candidatus Omnitrophota bacterium]
MKAAEEAINAEERLNTHISLDSLTKVVSIMVTGRAGSGFMYSLLDSHPSILSTPDVLMMGYYHFWLEHGHLPTEELVESFIDYYAVMFDAHKPSKCARTGSRVGMFCGFDSLGEKRDQVLTADVKIFRKSISHYLPAGKAVTRRTFFLALHVAYADAIGHRVDNDPIIVFGLHISHAPSVKSLIEDFPAAQFLHMVREPVQTVGSVFKHYWQEGRRNPGLFQGCIQGRFLSGYPVWDGFHAQSCAVRLEDLHRRPREVLLALCGWLGIPWSPVLLKSTVNGLQWWNDKSTTQVSGFNEAILSQKFTSYLSRFDKVRLKVLFHYRFSSWGYFCNDSWLGRSRIVKILCVPFLMLPFKAEWLLLKHTTSSLRDIFRHIWWYIKTRRLMIKQILKAVWRLPDATVTSIFP